METKICTRCKIDKSLKDYYKKASAKDGKQSECKSCHNSMTNKYRKTDRGKSRNAKYIKSDKGKAAKAKYDKSDKGKKARAKYMETDKGKATAARNSHNRRINILNTINNLTDKEFDFIVFTAQNNKCIGPDHEGSRYFTDKVKPQRDHINPVSKGGNFTKETVQALCRSCDSKKGAKYIDYRTKYHKEIIKNNMKGC